MTVTTELLHLPLGLLVPGDNVRTDLGDLAELATSIRSVGILEPLLVRPLPEQNTYEVVAGHRRLAAASDAGLIEAPCVVVDMDDERRDTVMLIENLMRKDLRPSEEASGYFRLVERGMDAASLAERIGRSTEHITGRLALLELTDAELAAVDAGTMTLASAEALLGARAKGVRDSLLKQVVKDALDGRNVERDAKHAIGEEAKHRAADKIVAAAVKRKLTVHVRKDYSSRFEGVLLAEPTANGYVDPSHLALDVEAHKAEPCHVVVVDLYASTGNAKPKVQQGCSDAKRHKGKKAESPLVVPEKPRSTKSDAEKAREAKEKERAERLRVRQATLAARMRKASLDKALLLITLADVDFDDAKGVTAMLGLDVVKEPHAWEKTAKGEPKMTADYHATIAKAAGESQARAREVAAALVIHRATAGYRIRGEHGTALKDLLAELDVEVNGADPDAPKARKPKAQTLPAEPDQVVPDPEPTPVVPDPEPVTGEAPPLVDNVAEGAAQEPPFSAAVMDAAQYQDVDPATVNDFTEATGGDPGEIAEALAALEAQGVA